MPLVELKNVSKTFLQGKTSLTALDSVSLSVEASEILGIIGYSGAGKSTLIRLINGLERASSGEVLVDGQNLTVMNERQLRKVRTEIGMIFQQFNLFRSRNVFGNIAYPLRVAGWAKADINKRVAELLDYVGLIDKAYAYPEQLSGGQKQRIGIARALATSPKILLADESTSALDPETTQDVLALLKRVNRDLGITIIAITHEMEVVRKIADRVVVLENGRVAETGSAYEVFSSPQTRAGQRFVSTVINSSPDTEQLAELSSNFPHHTVLKFTLGSPEQAPALFGKLAASQIPYHIVIGSVSTVQGRQLTGFTLAIAPEVSPSALEGIAGEFHPERIR